MLFLTWRPWRFLGALAVAFVLSDFRLGLGRFIELLESIEDQVGVTDSL